MSKVVRTSADSSRTQKKRKRAIGEISLLGDLLDERLRVPLDDFQKRFVQEGENGLRYVLFHYLAAERYRALRENSNRKFIEGQEHSHWPVPPQNLSMSYMVLPTKEEEKKEKERGKGKRGERNGATKEKRVDGLDGLTDKLAVPLARLIHPRRRKDGATCAPTKDTINVIRHGLLEESVLRETRVPPHPGVTMDQSYALHMALMELTETMWPACMKRWREVYRVREGSPSLSQLRPMMQGSELVPDDEEQINALAAVMPTLDPFLKRAVAEQAQTLLSDTFDWCLDLLQWPVERPGKWPQYSLDARNVLMAAERANVPPWILDRVKNRIRRLFPPMPFMEEQTK